MTTATVTTTHNSWMIEWEDVYKEELQGILNNEKLNDEMKKAGFNFLKNVDRYMESVLYDLSKIRHIFDTMNAESIMVQGINTLLSPDYLYEQHYRNGDYAIIKRIDDRSYIHFDPFVLETEMMAEFCSSTDYDNGEPYFYLNIRIYEDDPSRIDFDLEYHDLEHLAWWEEQQSKLKEFKNRLSEPINHEIIVDDEDDDEFEDDDENYEASEEALKLLSEMKFNQLKNLLRWQNAFDSIELQKRVDDNGEIYYLIQIMDKTISFTTVKCDKKGWNIHWGSSTPSEFKALIQKVMENK